MALRDWFSRKASEVGALLATVGLPPPTWMLRNYETFADEGFKKNVVAFSCINRLAQSCASVPLCAFVDGKEVEDHPALLMLRNPNPTMGGKRFIENWVGFYLIAGNAYIEHAAAGATNELWVHRPDRFSKEISATGLPSRYTYKVGQQKRVFEADILTGACAITHFKSFNPTDDVYGMSPLEAAAFSIDIHNEAGAYNKALLQNGGRPSGAMKVATKLQSDAYDRVKKQIDELIAGAKNAGRPLILESGMDWVEMGLTPKDMEFVTSKNTSARDICVVFGTPPMVLGIPGDNTYSNFTEANSALWRGTVIPLFGSLLDDLNLALRRTWPGLEIRPDYDDVPALAPERELLWKKIDASTELTVDEKRVAKGYEPLKGGIGEVVLVPAGLIPLGEDPIPPSADPTPPPKPGDKPPPPANEDDPPPEEDGN